MTGGGLSRFAQRTTNQSTQAKTPAAAPTPEGVSPDPGDFASFESSPTAQFMDYDFVVTSGEEEESFQFGAYPGDSWMQVGDNLKANEERGTQSENQSKESTTSFDNDLILEGASKTPTEVDGSHDSTVGTGSGLPTLTVPALHSPAAPKESESSSEKFMQLQQQDTTTAPPPPPFAPPEVHTFSSRFGPNLPHGIEMPPTPAADTPKALPSILNATGHTIVKESGANHAGHLMAGKLGNVTLANASRDQANQCRAMHITQSLAHMITTKTYQVVDGPGHPHQGSKSNDESRVDLTTPPPAWRKLPVTSTAAPSGVLKAPGSMFGRSRGATTESHTIPRFPMVTPRATESHKKVTFAADIKLANVTNITPGSNPTQVLEGSLLPPSLQMTAETPEVAPLHKLVVTPQVDPPTPAASPPETDFDAIHEEFEHNCRDTKDNVKVLVDEILDGNVHLYTHQAELQLLHAELVDFTDQLEGAKEELEKILREYSAIFPKDD